MPNALQAISIGAVILFVVVAIPVVVDNSTGQNSQIIQYEEGETVLLTDRINVTNVGVAPTDPGNATFVVQDRGSLESDTQTIQNGSEATFMLGGGNVTVAVTSITDSDTEQVTATVSYPTTYGWSDGARTLADNLGLLLVAGAFIVVLGLLQSVIA